MKDKEVNLKWRIDFDQKKTSKEPQELHNNIRGIFIKVEKTLGIIVTKCLGNNMKQRNAR